MGPSWNTYHRGAPSVRPMGRLRGRGGVSEREVLEGGQRGSYSRLHLNTSTAKTELGEDETTG